MDLITAAILCFNENFIKYLLLINLPGTATSPQPPSIFSCSVSLLSLKSHSICHPLVIIIENSTILAQPRETACVLESERFTFGSELGHLGLCEPGQVMLFSDNLIGEMETSWGCEEDLTIKATSSTISGKN